MYLSATQPHPREMERDRHRGRDHLDGVDVFDYYVKERTVRACSRCMRTSTAECRSNAPLITPARPRLAL